MKKKRKKGFGFELVKRLGRSWKSQERGDCNQHILYENKSIFNLKSKKKSDEKEEEEEEFEERQKLGGENQFNQN